MGRAGRGWLAGCVAAVFVVAGCTGGQADEDGQAGDAPGVIVPGGPGERATVLPADQAGGAATKPNAADVRYMSMMIPHHHQAIEMTDLVDDRAADEQVRALAGRIAVAQDAEIVTMRQWLDRHGHGGHEDAHGLMPGMATPREMAALKAASGPEFDRLFLRLMIAHHEGALTMAADQQANGIEPRALEMAQDVLSSQAAEIDRMRALLDGSR
ncbi:uncharacterized protein (DUF305 family) [Prauserella shujinwangii]|uniref:Uncharacterized protein (DUF305 family) n=1 Tax=Prauserella shujinwangii TaxID=1453103 RepID=A0A2T0LXG4_9PSEU|nr:DUF305 domain-containing protein [Prauserella shujinwangii]PRX48713.1 uncharacterized protein (DUF305 family) [Prauserella shujinwangii]